MESKIYDTYTDEELIAFSGEHLFYEISMLYGATLKLAGRETDSTIANALIESFGIHAAIVLDFMCNKVEKQDDAIANHFITDQLKWRNIYSSYYKRLEFIYRRRGKELAHLSYERMKITNIEKQWCFVAICREISDLVDSFIEMSDKTKTHANVLSLKNKFRNNPLCKSIFNFDALPLILSSPNIDIPVLIRIPQNMPLVSSTSTIVTLNQFKI